MTHNGHRKRLTKGTAKHLDVEVLEQAYAKTQIFLRCVREGLIKPSPIGRAKSQRHRIILRNELLRRKFSKEAVDTEPEIPEGLRKELKELEAQCETGKP